MGFNSIDFAIFFPTVTLLYFILPHRVRWLVLLAASCLFYMTFVPVFILILAFTITVDYIAGLAIERTSRTLRKNWLIMSIIANVGVLIFFKYANFFGANLNALAQFLHWQYSIQALAIILPIGLSFHTFQSLSYTIEVYRGHQRAERRPWIFALYVMFYPQLVAGPIERPQNLLHQFDENHHFDIKRLTSGLGLMLFGFFKKLVVADSLAIFIDQIYKQPSMYHGLSVAIATAFFAVQIYADFSGYSDIARGAARVMGFHLMENFRQPYFSRSIREFWTRWHISLSTWFRDYVYFPLGGSRNGHKKWLIAILATFLLSGFWHGANWTFVVWGALNGLYIIIGTTTKSFRDKIREAFGWNHAPKLLAVWQTFLTFGLACVSWVFFRAASVSAGWQLLVNMFTGWLQTPNIYIDLPKIQFFGALAAISTLFFVEYWIENKIMDRIMIKYPAISLVLRWGTTITALALIIYSLIVRPVSPQFIYFQF